jgi:hypothetical protein
MWTRPSQHGAQKCGIQAKGDSEELDFSNTTAFSSSTVSFLRRIGDPRSVIGRAFPWISERGTRATRAGHLAKRGRSDLTFSSSTTKAYCLVIDGVGFPSQMNRYRCPFRTFVTRAGWKQQTQVPVGRRTLGYATPREPDSRSSSASFCDAT